MRCSAGSGFFMVLVGSVSTRGQSVESANKWPLIVVCSGCFSAAGGGT